MFRILYWDQIQNEKRALLSYTTIAETFKEAIQNFEVETKRAESSIYSINVIN